MKHSNHRPAANMELILTAFQTYFSNTSDMIFIKDINLTYTAVSAPFVKMVGKNCADEIIGHTDIEIFDDENLARRYRTDDEKLLAGGCDLVDYIEPLTDDAGYARYASTSKYILWDASGNAIGILGISKDITREYLAFQHYQQELTYLFELPPDTYAAVFIDIDDWRIISQRRQLVDDSTMQSCYTVEKLRDYALDSFVDQTCEAASFYQSFSPDFLRTIYKSGQSSISFKYLRKMVDASIRWVFNEVRFLTDPESGHLCAMLSAKDIDAQKREELDLAVSATMDKMTMVLNRETTIKQIKQILGEESDRLHALFMIDTDNFKSLNDTFGHQAGDEFLIALAKELQGCFGESDVIGRIGGDEFFALMKNVPDLSAVKKKAQTLLETLQKLCRNYPSIPLSASFGISLYPKNGSTLAELYAQADSALYQAKRTGKNRFVFADTAFQKPS